MYIRCINYSINPKNESFLIFKTNNSFFFGSNILFSYMMVVIMEWRGALMVIMEWPGTTWGHYWVDESDVCAVPYKNFHLEHEFPFQVSLSNFVNTSLISQRRITMALNYTTTKVRKSLSLSFSFSDYWC